MSRAAGALAGSAFGPAGTVVGGADWQILHGESLAELDARITLRTDDGHFILLRASGRRFAPPDVLKLVSSAIEVKGAEAIKGAKPGGD